MRTRTRLALVSLCTAVLFFAAPRPLGAQIHGVAPSVTSFGFGGSNNPTPGVPASVTSLGPLGWDCCSGPFIAPFQGTGFRGHHFRNHHRFPIGELTPAVIPYFVPYPVPYDDYTEEEYNPTIDRASSPVPLPVYERGPWYREGPATRYLPPEPPPVHSQASPKEAPPAVPEPIVEVVQQPATVLVYKDGHKQEVQNYAIVGDTLFAFSGNRSHKIQLADLDLAATRKTNDDRGVEFRIPGEKDSGQ